MPLIVNREEIRETILNAFQECVDEKPLTKVTMRDIAAKAGMSHSKILYYLIKVFIIPPSSYNGFPMECGVRKKTRRTTCI